MRIALYLHGGSKNHGCEAIVRATRKILNTEMVLYSAHPDEDFEYGIEKICHIEEQGNQIKRYSLRHIFAKLIKIVTGNSDYYYKYRFKNLLKSSEELYLSIGGDNYCYGNTPEFMAYINQALRKKAPSVLWGCSIEPDLLAKRSIVEDLKRYTLITARESITYQALLEAGVTDNVKLYPDPAFQLDNTELPLPEGFADGNTIGINLSPMIIGCEEHAGVTLNAYKALIQHIISTTEMQVALIPHVVWELNDDRKPLRQLYAEFQDSGRVVMIEDHNCMELKGFISRCRLFIGARTHATIAAYSTCVPTLVVGYSVKAKGIAKDIFGTHENYVVPVQTLENSDDLVKAFEWLRIQENEIRSYLKMFMPTYIEKAGQAAEEIRKLL